MADRAGVERVYSAEYLRTGFQGGLNWYRCRTQNVDSAELELFSGRQIEAPSFFIAGRKDWGIYQVPGSIARMQNSACTRMRPHVLVDGAGHWVQQEQFRRAPATRRESPPRPGRG
jgi:pimeloyl-ACP methyl ester carboxylesterase